MWSMSAWDDPAPSTVTSRLFRYGCGICRMASVRTAMWSAAVFDPALPRRSAMVRFSPVLSHHVVSGWWPKVRLNVAAASSLSLCAITMLASSRMTTVSPRSRPATGTAVSARAGQRSAPTHARGWRPVPYDAVETVAGDLLQRPPRSRHRRHRAEQLLLVQQRGNIADPGATVGEGDGDIGQHPAPVVQRHEPGAGHRPRQTAGESDPIGQQPQRRRPDVGDDPPTADLDRQATRPPRRIHLESASRLWVRQGLQTPLSSQVRGTFPVNATPTGKIIESWRAKPRLAATGW